MSATLLEEDDIIEEALEDETLEDETLEDDQLLHDDELEDQELTLETEPQSLLMDELLLVRPPLLPAAGAVRMLKPVLRGDQLPWRSLV